MCAQCSLRVVGLFTAASQRNKDVNWHCWGAELRVVFNSSWLLWRGEPIITTTNDFTPLTPMMCSEPNHREAQKGCSGGTGASTKEASPLFADRKSRKMKCAVFHEVRAPRRWRESLQSSPTTSLTRWSYEYPLWSLVLKRGGGVC